MTPPTPPPPPARQAAERPVEFFKAQIRNPHTRAAYAAAVTRFFTSANFTGHALDPNLKIGVLVSGGQSPRRLIEHFLCIERERHPARV